MISICDQASGWDNERFLLELSRRVWGRRIPISGSLDLTHRCNLACVHCYARVKPEQELPQAELSTGQWLKIIHDLEEAGCLYLLLTGGEPLLREDFPEIYTAAKKSGMLVTVFSNGTRVDERIMGLFRELPPRLVEISIYGASAGTQDRITGVRGSFERALQGIGALLAAGIPVRLKSVLMALNNDDFPAIEKLARDLGVMFRFDPAIFPTLGGDRAPLELRVAPERAVALEMAEPGRMAEWRQFLESCRDLHQGDGLFNCGSGVNTFHIDAYGWLFPCLMVRKLGYPLGSGSFQEGWRQTFNDFRNGAPDAAMPCRHCDKKLLCGYCPGFFEMENGSGGVPSKYTCSIGEQRFAKMNAREYGG